MCSLNDVGRLIEQYRESSFLTLEEWGTADDLFSVNSSKSHLDALRKGIWEVSHELAQTRLEFVKADCSLPVVDHVVPASMAEIHGNDLSIRVGPKQSYDEFDVEMKKFKKYQARLEALQKREYDRSTLRAPPDERAALRIKMFSSLCQPQHCLREILTSIREEALAKDMKKWRDTRAEFTKTVEYEICGAAKMYKSEVESKVDELVDSTFLSRLYGTGLVANTLDGTGERLRLLNELEDALAQEYQGIQRAFAGDIERSLRAAWGKRITRMPGIQSELAGAQGSFRSRLFKLLSRLEVPWQETWTTLSETPVAQKTGKISRDVPKWYAEELEIIEATMDAHTREKVAVAGSRKEPKALEEEEEIAALKTHAILRVTTQALCHGDHPFWLFLADPIPQSAGDDVRKRYKSYGKHLPELLKELYLELLRLEWKDAEDEDDRVKAELWQQARKVGVLSQLHEVPKLVSAYGIVVAEERFAIVYPFSVIHIIAALEKGVLCNADRWI